MFVQEVSTNISLFSSVQCHFQRIHLHHIGEVLFMHHLQYEPSVLPKTEITDNVVSTLKGFIFLIFVHIC